VGAGLSLAENPLVELCVPIGPVGKLSGWFAAADEIAGVIVPSTVNVVAHLWRRCAFEGGGFIDGFVHF